MKNRLKTIEITKKYIEAFNRRDLKTIEEMLDERDVCFVRQAEPTILGREAILNRTRKSLDKLDRQGHQLHMINAIIDVKDISAHPCMLGIMDGDRHSVVVLSCHNNAHIASISILVTKEFLKKARPLEPAAPREIAELHSMKPKLTHEELVQRREILTEKAIHLQERLKTEGPTNELMGKFDRLQDAQKKLKQDEYDILYQD
ncbi:MAG: hypothetical protein ACNI26_09950 [Terasakiella sp.]|uniref:hypothetical protein n=1 Tax=unclassified Terasakiella TaxID=2614952 RepID=UPI003AFF7CE5